MRLVLLKSFREGVENAGLLIVGIVLLVVSMIWLDGWVKYLGILSGACVLGLWTFVTGQPVWDYLSEKIARAIESGENKDG